MEGYSKSNIYRRAEKHVADNYFTALTNPTQSDVSNWPEDYSMNEDPAVLEQQSENIPVVTNTQLVGLDEDGIGLDDSFDAVTESDNDDTADVAQTPNESNNQDMSYSDLAAWAVSNNVTQVSLTKLLKILKTHECFKNIPTDARTLLQTPKCSEGIVIMPPGNYCHYGSADGIKYIFMATPKTMWPERIEILINIDGIPLSKSSNSQFWPILGKLAHMPLSSPFVIGVYHGYGKPESAANYLQYFVAEAKTLLREGIIIGDVRMDVGISGYICDAPARSFVKGIKSHTGYYGCGKCWARGTWRGRVVFLESSARLRTDDDFSERRQGEDHHLRNSPLEELGTGMVSEFPYEYMHLVCLGVIRKIMRIWLRGKLTLRWGRLDMDNCSEQLISLTPFICREFARKPRSLREMDRWKATEWRQLLLYTGPVVLKRPLPEHLYDHFLCLHVAIRILACKHLKHLFAYAEELLAYYVQMFQELYGEESITYNVHGLIHLAQDAMKYGSLDEFSAFGFENHLQLVKNQLRKANQPLQQLSNRLENMNLLPPKTNCETVLDLPSLNSANNTLKLRDFVLTTKMGDNCCVLQDDSVIVIERFIQESTGINILGRRFLNTSDLYINPCKSSILGIIKVSNLSGVNSWSARNIKNKVMKIPMHDYFVILPLCHLD